MSNFQYYAHLRKVERFSQEGILEATLNIPLETTSKMAVDSDGNIWITFPSELKVRKYDGNIQGNSDGIQLAEISNVNNTLYHLEVDKTLGKVFIMDKNPNAGNPKRIQQYSTNGDYEHQIFINADLLQFAVDKNILVGLVNSSYELHQYNLENFSLISASGGRGTPVGFTLGVSDLEYDATSGVLYVSEDLNQNNRIQVLASPPEIHLKLNGDDISANQEVDLGSYPIGSAHEFTFTIYSLGLVNVNLTGNPKIDKTGSANFLINAESLPNQIRGSANFKVIYNPSIGTQTAAITIANNDADKSNFTFVIKANGTGTTPQSINNFTKLPQKTYGDEPLQLSAIASSGLPISFTSADPSVATVVQTNETYYLNILAAGDTQIEVSQSGDAMYKAISKTLYFSVLPAVLVAKADSKTRAYGDPNPTPTITYTGFKNGDDESVIDNKPNATFTGSENSNAGSTETIILSGGNDNNYTFMYENGTLTIVPATLNVKAKDKVITYGDPIPAEFDVEYNGFKNNENINLVVVSPPTASTTAQQNSNADTYDINLENGSVNSNYTLVREKGILTINKAQATVEVSYNPEVYDGAPKNVSVTTSPEGLPVIITYNDQEEPPVNAGTYAVKSMIDHINYKGEAESQFIIGKANASVTITEPTTIYNGAPQSIGIITSPENLQTSVLYDGVHETPINAATYTVSVTVNEENYEGQTTGSFTIEKATQTIMFEVIDDIMQTATEPFALIATATSGLPVTFEVITGPVLVTNAMATVTGGFGDATIRAVQEGNNNYHAAEAVEQSFTVLENLVLSTDNPFTAHISVWPIPASDVINISTSTYIMTNLAMFDAFGRSVMNATPQRSTYLVNTKTFSSGLYTLHITTQKGTAIMRVLILGKN